MNQTNPQVTQDQINRLAGGAEVSGIEHYSCGAAYVTLIRDLTPDLYLQAFVSWEGTPAVFKASVGVYQAKGKIHIFAQLRSSDLEAIMRDVATAFASRTAVAWRGDLDATTWWHATSIKNLTSILGEGLKAGSYWTDSPSVLEYYVDTIRDDGEVPVVIAITSTGIHPGDRSPDMPGIEEPITTCIGISEEDVQAEWASSTQDADASLAIVRSVKVLAPIPPHILKLCQQAA